MVLVDSSVWITALDPNKPGAYRARIQLEELLNHFMVSVCDSVRFDVLQRISPDNRSDFLSYFSQLPVLPVKASTWNIAIQIAWEMQVNQIDLSQGEAVVAALALQNQMPLFSLSPDQIAVSSIRRLKLLQ